MARNRVPLSALREIGWAYWDPIGLLDPGADWREQPYADEYDTYLLRAFSGLAQGWEREEAVAYLMRVEAVHMGLGERGDARDRARATVEAIVHLAASGQDS